MTRYDQMKAHQEKVRKAEEAKNKPSRRPIGGTKAAMIKALQSAKPKKKK